MPLHTSASNAAHGAAERRLIILGSSGSIGTQTLDVVRHLNRLHDEGAFPFRYRVVGLATGSKAGELAAQAAEFGVADVALADVGAAKGLAGDGSLRVRSGADAAERLVREVECDVVLAAVVGAAGLPATLAAIELGRDIALANKETLVAAGELVVPAAVKSGSRLLPVDSEHAGVWQCLLGGEHGRLLEEGVEALGADPCVRRLPGPPMRCSAGIARIVLTASGGPFRLKSRDEVYNATREQALNHPTWKMGPKVTVDSASLTNKALEIIEAHWLFGVAGEKIEALVHPQSIIHAMVEFADGTVLTQLGAPDMRSPIQAALTFPARPEGVSRKLDLLAMGRLDFSPPDLERFPALGLAYEVIREGGTSGAVFNAANEAAVELFLGGSIPFGRIPELAAQAMRDVGSSPLRSLADVVEADRAARAAVHAAQRDVGAGVRS